MGPAREPRSRPRARARRGRRKGSNPLPILRFSRDKRGYENTFIVHSSKRRGKSRSRILYWFRTPPAVRVGRAALDEEAIRLIEEHNPDVQFDWTRILKGQDEIIPEAKPRPELDRRPSRPQRGHEPAPPAQREKVEAALPKPPIAPIVVVAEATPQPHVELAPMLALAADEPETAALRRLGPEGLLRLRARHAEVLARISEKITETERRDELKAQAERLNPDTWVTDGEVAAGLEQYESVFESLRGVVGRRRKRRKRRSGRPPGATEQGAASHEDEPAGHEPSADDAEPDEE